MMNYVPISASAAIRRHFRDEQETGPALTVTNWECRQTQRPCRGVGEEMPCVSIHKRNPRACPACRAPPGTERTPPGHTGSPAALAQIRLASGSFAQRNAKAAFVMHQCPQLAAGALLLTLCFPLRRASQGICFEQCVLTETPTLRIWC